MTESVFERFYRNVPTEQVDMLRDFRATHPYRQVVVAGQTWRYIASGEGDNMLLLLPGGIRSAEAWFRLLLLLESNYRIIAPTYPVIHTMQEAVNGIETILEIEQVQTANIIGTSLGGQIAQCFVRAYPQRVDKLILSNTGVPGGGKLIGLVLKIMPLFPKWYTRLALVHNFLPVLNVKEEDRAFMRAFLTELYASEDVKREAVSMYSMALDFGQNYLFSSDDLAGWRGQMLIIDSENDPIFHAKQRSALKTLYPQAQVHTFADAGHTPAYSRPTEYATVLDKFLNQPHKLEIRVEESQSDNSEG